MKHAVLFATFGFALTVCASPWLKIQSEQAARVGIVGMMVSLVDKKEFHDQKDLLSAHAQWEINYWHEHASRVKSNIRQDLMGSNNGLKVTEIKAYNDKGAQMSSYLIGLAANDGVFVLSVSPARKEVDPLVKELVSSFKLAHQKLDPGRVKNLASEAKAHD
jgi:hypothetical protein